MEKPKSGLEFYVDHAGLHRWRVTAKNGKIIYSSSQGYVNKIDCLENAFNIYIRNKQ